MIAHRFLFVCFIPCLAMGCIPEKRIVWSPDGKSAAVCAPKGLYLINAQGKVLPHRLSGETFRCGWFPDGKQLAVAHAVKNTDWKVVARSIDPKVRERIERSAASARSRILAYDGKWDDFQLDPENALTPGEEGAVVLYLVKEKNEGLAEKFGDKWEDVQEASVNLWRLQTFDMTKDALVPGRLLHTSLDEITQPKVSFTGSLVAFVLIDSLVKDAPPSLEVVSITGGEPRRVATFVSYDYDWSPDGRSLALIRAANTDFKESAGVVLGSLTTVNVTDEKGALLAQPSELKDRVGLLFNMLAGVRWLADDRILFAASEVTLPATTRDMPQGWTLFMLDLRAPACAARVIGRDFNESIDPGQSLFEVSPDRTRVVLPGVNGRWIVHDLRDGSTHKIMEEKDTDGKSPFLPSWRNNEELCAPSLEKKREDGTKYTEVLIWRDGNTQSLSADWPSEMTDGWLTGNR